MITDRDRGEDNNTYMTVFIIKGKWTQPCNETHVKIIKDSESGGEVRLNPKHRRRIITGEKREIANKCRD